MIDSLILAAVAAGIVYLAMALFARRRERELAEARAHEARLKSLTELSADWFWETDGEHRVTWLSGGGPVALLFGEPTFGKRFWEMPGIEVDAHKLEALRERLGRELPFFDLEIARTDERGARQVHIVSGTARYETGPHGSGRFLGYRGVGRDITGERRAEATLARAKDRLELALDGGNLAEWHLDLVGDELYVGDGWVRFLGHDRSPPVRSSADLERLMHPDDVPGARAALVRVLKGSDSAYDIEMRVRRKRSGWHWLHIRARVTERGPDGRARLMSGIVADIDARKRAEQALREAEARHRSVLDAAPNGVIVLSDGRIEYANAAAARMLRAASPDELVGRDVFTLFDPAEVRDVQERRRELLQAPHVTDFRERRMRCLDGTPIVVEAAGVSYYQGGRLVIQVMYRDVTESRRAREAIAERDQRFRDVGAVSGEYVWEVDRDWRYTYLSERAEAVLGYPRAEVLGRKLWELLPLGEERQVRERLAAQGNEGAPFRDVVHRVMTWQGAVIWQSMSGLPLSDAAGRWQGYRGTAADVTARKRAEARIAELTSRDALTGLANRAQFAERVAQAITRAARSRGQLALLVVDLDRFKLVNESLGHAAGDALLRAVGERLASALRREDLLARPGGDEYLVLWDGLKSREEAVMLGERLLALLARPFDVEGRPLTVGASIGMALYPRDGRDFGELLKHADAALYHAKDCGRGSFHFFHPSMSARAAERLRMENELRTALTRGELVLHWQPVMNGSVTHGRCTIVGAEALVRWQHSERGLLGPEEFVPLAEDCGLIRAVGEWTLERAVARIGAWQRELPGAPWFAVNVSAPELAQGDAFVERVRECLRAHGVDGRRLELEVTERVLMSRFEENAETLRRIGDLGVRFAIDDFGTGYSSLAYLRHLPIDKLKIDRVFLDTLESNATDQAIVRTIVSLAHTLGVAVAAEGVEYPAQLDKLLELGCEQWQGRLFSAALDAQSFASCLISAAGPKAATKSG